MSQSLHQVSVVSISATSISLSWSVLGEERVDSWEVAVRQADNRGTTISSGPLSLTTYTISQLEPTTLYTLTVSATNVAGTTNSTPIIVSTACNKSFLCSEPSLIFFCLFIATDVCQTESSMSSVIIGGAAAAGFIIATLLTVVVILILVLRSRSGTHSAKTRHETNMTCV